MAGEGIQEITKEHKDKLGGDEYVHYLDSELSKYSVS